MLLLYFMERRIPPLQRKARLAFYLAGTSMSEWSRMRGYEVNNVSELIRYAARTLGYIPRGNSERARIARDLEEDLGLVLVRREAAPDAAS